MFTIYSPKDIVHINKVSLGFFQMTTPQNCNQGITNAVEDASAKEKMN